MRIFKIIDDHLKLHKLGMDQELQKNLGPEWKVEYYHAQRRGAIKRVYPTEDDKDFFDFGPEDEVFVFWNYFWGNDYKDRVFQDKVKERVLELIKQGFRIKMEIYTSYGDYCESERELKEYREYFGENIVVDRVPHIMHHESMIPAWAESEARIINSFYAS